MTIAGRQQGWLSSRFHTAFREILHQAADQYQVVVPAYCLMPDHLHLLAAGIAPAADQRLWVRAVRRSINQDLAPFRLQKQGYDHVLRPAESGRDAFVGLVHYLCENPVRAGLVSRPENWPYSGACVPALPDLDPRATNFTDQWWSYWATCHS
jgi:REP element-mobilizing transposase RayT